MRNGKFAEAEDVEKEIEKIKDEEFEDFKRPVTAFITFETEEGVLRAKALKEGDAEFFGHSLTFVEPADPTDIIWENRHFTKKDKAIRTTIVVIFTIFLLAITFIALLFLQKYVQKHKYASSVNCEQIEKIYPTDDYFQFYAFKDWYGYYESPQKTAMSGILQCYCKKYQATNGYYDTFYADFTSGEFIDENG